MNGIQLAKSYYDAYGRELLAAFPELENKIALGIAGSGSECLGYDDEVSQDHDFEPGFCIFAFVEDGADADSAGVPGGGFAGKALTRMEAFALERAYAKLPKEFEGFTRSLMSPVGGNRRGLVDLREFLLQTTGTADGVLTPEQWLHVPEESLLEATNGQIWQDAGGIFTPVRERLSYLPEDVRRKKLAGKRYETLLVPLARNGKCVLEPENRNAMKAQARTKAGLETLDETQKRLLNPHTYPVGLERDLFNRRSELVSTLRGIE